MRLDDAQIAAVTARVCSWTPQGWQTWIGRCPACRAEDALSYDVEARQVSCSAGCPPDRIVGACGAGMAAAGCAG